ncbi:FG-GAP-like repeat-containing protein [Roseomonas sp. AR75]|uniref:FG-GAP-like repeat-containing protein n=1 Tax=Roseomonas sp. AR75 TaxID=2562311 RepID=UPI0010C11F77|nr:FG-GAP-like repeat-containing protein [Roseomonas sp. AR75]
MSISLTGFGPSVTFGENAVNAAPQVIDGDVTLSYSGPVALTGISVSGLLAQDRVSIANQGIGAGQIGFNGSVVSFGGLPFGTVSGGVGGTFTVAFTAAPSATALDALIQALTYANVFDAPATARTLTLAIEPLFGSATVRNVTVAVTRENDAPLIVSGSAASFAENGTGIAYQAAAIDPDGATGLTWSLQGLDASQFTIDSAGAVRFNQAPDFEGPLNSLADNVHRITVTVSDGLASASRAVDIVVTNVNEPPRLAVLPGALTFGENAANAGPLLLFPAVAFSAENGMAGGTLHVAGLLPEDRITILSQGNGADEVGFEGTTIRYGGIAVGTATGGDGTALILRFNDAATAESTQAVIRALAYANVSDTPTAARTLTLMATDASGQKIGSPWTPSFALLTGAASPVDGFEAGAWASPALGDLDGDGRLDLVAIGTDGGFRLSAWRNTGTGFEPFAAFEGLPVAPWGVPALGDLDGDGLADIVVGSSGGLAAYRNADTGWEALPGNQFAGVTAPVGAAPALGDLDGDGLLDLVLGGSDGTLSAWRNTGTGFVAFATNPFDGISVTEFSAPSLGDLDGDGLLDLVLGDEEGGLSVWRNTGAGFQALAANPFTGATLSATSKPAIGDVDGDGRADLIAGEFFDRFTAWRGTADLPAVSVTVTAENDLPVLTVSGSVTFAENGSAIVVQATASDADATGPLSWSLAGADAALFTIDATGAVRFALAPDFEQPQDQGRDNVHDIVVAVSDGTATTIQAVAITVTNVPEVPRLGGVGAFAAFAEGQVNTAPRLLAPAATFALGDTLAGATLTVAGLLAEDRVTILPQGDAPGQIGFDGTVIRFGGTELGTASGGEGAPFVVSLTGAADGPAVQALLGRLAYANASETPTLFRTLTLDLVQANGGAPGGPAAPAFTLLSDAANPFAAINAGSGAAPALGDIDGDGLPDLVVGNSSGMLSAWRNTGAGFEPFVTNPFALIDVGDLSKPALGDINGDGLLDLAVGNANGTVSAWRNTGSGFEDFPTNPFAGIDVGTRSTPAFGDIDADGLPDLVVGEDFGALAAWRNTGLGFELFATNPFAGVPAFDYAAPALGDIDRDGRADLVLGDDNARLEVWRNTDSGFVRLATSPFSYGVLLEDSTPTLGDFDGDGHADLVAGGFGGGKLAAWRNVTPPAASLAVAVTAEDDAPAGPRVVTLAPSAEDATRVITPAQLLAGWSDPEGAALQALDLAVISDPVGTLVDNGNGTWSFTPALNDNSNVVFAFDVSDGANKVGAVARMDLTPLNDAPTGIVNLLLNGGSNVMTASADLKDVDGLGDIAFRWQAFTGGAWQDIAGANGTGFVPGAALHGTLMRAVARYTDGDGTVENVASAFVARVGGAADDNFGAPGSASQQAGGAGNDTLAGSNQRDVLVGGTGNDRLIGNNGNDILIGDAGADTLTGGLGADFFRYVRPVDGGDMITDFQPGTDVIQLDASFFKGLPVGTLNPANFAAGAPTAALPQVLYASGALSFDADGTGAFGATLIATLTGAPAITSADIFVIP